MVQSAYSFTHNISGWDINTTSYILVERVCCTEHLREVPFTALEDAMFLSFFYYFLGITLGFVGLVIDGDIYSSWFVYDVYFY